MNARAYRKKLPGAVPRDALALTTPEAHANVEPLGAAFCPERHCTDIVVGECALVSSTPTSFLRTNRNA